MSITYHSGSQTNLGAANSNLTGAPWFVGDFRQLTISVQTSTASASMVTVMGTNSDGLGSALGTMTSMIVPTGGWSIITGIPNQGMYTIDVGFRWVTSFRSNIAVSAASNTTIIFAART